MVLELIEGLGPWAWWILGILLLGVEILAPGNVLVWFGLAALVVGGVALFYDPGWQTELIVFAVLSLVLVVLGRSFFARRAASGEEPLLNQRATRLIGRTFVLTEPIVQGAGRLRIDDTSWRIAGPDLPSGRSVRIIGHDGSVLTVTADGG